jgi:hypothetical protein
MPVACNTSALTGQEGSIYFKPAGTQFCLLDHTDFPAGTDITVPTENDYRLGDAVQFTVEGSASIDSGLTAGTTYYIVAIADGNGTISVAATSGGTAITLQGDGGASSADTPGDANHIKIAPADFAVVCQVREFSVEISREELDVTTLPCDPCGAGGDGKYAQFRKTQSGYASGTGSMTVYFTDDQTSLANRLLANVMLRSQEGAEVKLYINTECSGGQVVDADSIYIESGISITSMSLSVTPDDATSAELSFTINNPKHILTTDIT